MNRVISVFLPNWPTERLGRALLASAPDAETSSAPLILSLKISNRREIYAMNAQAQAAGLRVGMTVTKAQALVPGLVIQDAAPNLDADSLERLALWTLQLYSPIAAADHPSGLVIDATGAAHLHGGEASMLLDIVQRLQTVGVTARTAMADSWGAAHAFARYSPKPVTVVPPGESVALLLHLPLVALRLPGAMVAGLRKLGFERIGDLADKPRAPLALRFGPELHRRLDQAMGRLAESIAPARQPDMVEASRLFAEPIGAPETLARYTGILVESVCMQLQAKDLGARRLDLLFHRVDRQLQAIRIGTSSPVRDVKRLKRLLCDKLETIDPGFGVEQMSLCATMVEPFEAKQTRTSLLSDEIEVDISGAIDVLANRVGGHRLYRFTPVDSDVPERAVGRVAATANLTGNEWPSQWPRPTRLLSPAEPIETFALLPDNPPVSFSWRGIRRRVRRADGPERVFGEWWKRDAELSAVRDYFHVEDDAGERFWIYRAGDGEDTKTGSHRWFMHGIFG